MSEMLGNRYFLARQFDKAIPYLEQAPLKNPSEDKIRKRLIICYIQVGRIRQAFSIFYEIVRRDARIISETDIYYDDCPCTELIPYWLRKMAEAGEDPEILKILAMLFLYCDVDKSIEYFDKVRFRNKESAKITTILKKLKMLRKVPH